MNIEQVIAEEAAASEANKDAEMRTDSVTSRGHARSRTLQVRLNEEELESLTELAAARGIPVSTLARDLLMHQINESDRSVGALIARLRTELDTLAAAVA